jgi:hypothetical protein
MARHLGVDPAAAAELCPGVQLLSMQDYLRSLVPVGGVSLEGAVVSGLERLGLRAALPLALLLPPSWQKTGGARRRG